MIQRRQTLFLFQLIFFGIAMLFIPVNHVQTTSAMVDVSLVPINIPGLQSTVGHMAAVYLNFTGLVFAFITIFLYNKRELQVKMCYASVVLWVVLGLMMAFCPFVEKTEAVVEIRNTYYGCGVAVFAIIAALVSARYIKKDIALLKSADRIR